MTPTGSRLAATMAVGCLLALVAPGEAARRPMPKPACNLMTDPRDNSASPSLDILSGDIATGRSTLVWVLRVADLASTADPTTTMGRRYEFHVTVDGKPIGFAVSDGPAGPRDESALGATVTMNAAKNEVRYAASLSTVASVKSVSFVPGATRVSQLIASAFVVGQPIDPYTPGLAVGSRDDTTTSSRVYTTGKPSCVGAIP